MNILPADIKIEFPEKRLADFPPGTFFRATAQVCQEHWPQTGKPKGDPYVVASNIYVHRIEGTPDANDNRQRSSLGKDLLAEWVIILLQVIWHTRQERLPPLLVVEIVASERLQRFQSPCAVRFLPEATVIKNDRLN
nr:MetaGeneMark_Unknown Function [uncultured bacterium]